MSRGKKLVAKFPRHFRRRFGQNLSHSKGGSDSTNSIYIAAASSRFAFKEHDSRPWDACKILQSADTNAWMKETLGSKGK